MSEEMTQFRTEGQPAFPIDTENDNSAGSSPDKTEADTTQSDGGDNSQTQKDTPFHEHPRWKEREEAWNKRFNEQESRHQQDIKSVREEFGQKRKDNAEQTQIPSWFGGSQEQWDAYRADRDVEIKAAEERAYQRVTQVSQQEQKLIDDATKYMQSELAAIEADTSLNPDGEKIDPNKLLKFVLDNDLVDSKGKWNYRAGYRLMRSQNPAPAPRNKDRKSIAGATTSDSKGDPKPSTYKTAKDFKTKRPW